MRLGFWIAFFAALTIGAVSVRSAAPPWLSWVDAGEYAAESAEATRAR